MDECTCEYEAGQFFWTSKLVPCKVHHKATYACIETGCHDYRPKHKPDPSKGHWPRCVCGEISQQHN